MERKWEGKETILQTTTNTDFEDYLIELMGFLFCLFLIGFYNPILHRCFVSSNDVLSVSRTVESISVMGKRVCTYGQGQKGLKNSCKP